MKIQIVSQHYHPDNFSINDMARELVSRGHEVRVLTGLPDYATSKIPREYKRLRRRKEVIDGVLVRRVTTVARRRGVFFRALNYASFAASASIFALISGNTELDAIFVNQTSPVFQAIPAIIFKRRTKKKLVLYCYDLWPESLKAWGVGEKNPVFKLVLWISRAIYRQCDVVAVTSRPFMEYLEKVCNVDSAKLVYLPQYARDDYKDIAGQYEENNRADFLFAGNVGAVQNLDCVLRAASLIKTDKSFCVHIVGDGSQLDILKELSKQLELKDRVIFHGRRPKEDMKEFYRMADCFLLTLWGGDFIGLTLPGKAQGYLCAGKPVLAAIDGAGNQLVSEAGCGAAVPAGDFEALSQKMTDFIENPLSYRQMGLAGRRFYEENYTEKIFFKRLMEIISQGCGR